MPNNHVVSVAKKSPNRRAGIKQNATCKPKGIVAKGKHQASTNYASQGGQIREADKTSEPTEHLNQKPNDHEKPKCCKSNNSQARVNTHGTHTHTHPQHTTHNALNRRKHMDENIIYFIQSYSRSNLSFTTTTTPTSPECKGPASSSSLQE